MPKLHDEGVLSIINGSGYSCIDLFKHEDRGVRVAVDGWINTMNLEEAKAFAEHLNKIIKELEDANKS